MKIHSNAFDGLLSLIPAKHLYDDATKDQWQQKKKSKKEAIEARRAKLDPDAINADSYNNAGASAKDVMDNRAKTAKSVSLPGKRADNQNDESESVSLPPKKKASPKKDVPIGEHEDQQPNMQVSGQATHSARTSNDPESNPVKMQRSIKDVSKKALTPEEQELKNRRRTEMKEKLAKKIELMREKRKAPGTKSGGPVKSREQMLAERKSREEHKRREKLKRKQEREDSDKSDDDDNDEEESFNEDENEEGVLFGTIQFKDGTRMTSDLQNIRSGVDRKKKKGPANKDIKAHLLKLEAKRKKLENLSPEERKAQEKQEQWKSLMNQAEGIKVKDSEKLLKKSLKRKEKQKLKSEIEWRDRKQNVKDTISARQKRREANLKSRRENKGKKSKNIPKLRLFTGTVLKPGKGGAKDRQKRAGFEGNAKSKGKGKLGK